MMEGAESQAGVEVKSGIMEDVSSLESFGSFLSGAGGPHKDMKMRGSCTEEDV